MLDGVFRSSVGRVCAAAILVQCMFIAHTTQAWGQVRQGAPISFAAMAPSERAASAAAPTPTGPRVLDLRRAPGGAASVTPPAAASPTRSAEAPEWLAQEQVGPPYQEAGVWYVPTPEPGYSEMGGLAISGRTSGATESGEAFDPGAQTAAHPTLPLPSLLQVTDLATGREIIVRLNDRGPFAPGRIVGLSPAAVSALGAGEGAQVHVRYLGPAPRRVVGAGGSAQASAEPGVSIRPAAARIDEGPIAPDTPIAQLPLPPHLGVGTERGVRAGAASRMSGSQSPLGGGLAVQIGAFANLENAHALRERVRDISPVAIEPLSTPEGELFRVRLGPFSHEAEAEAAHEAAARLGVNGRLVSLVR